MVEWRMWCLPRPQFIKEIPFTGTCLQSQQLRLSSTIGGMELRSCKLSRWGNASTTVLTEYQLKAGRRSWTTKAPRKKLRPDRTKRKRKKKEIKNRTYTLGKSCERGKVHPPGTPLASWDGAPQGSQNRPEVCMGWFAAKQREYQH